MTFPETLFPNNVTVTGTRGEGVDTSLWGIRLRPGQAAFRRKPQYYAETWLWFGDRLWFQQGSDT